MRQVLIAALLSLLGCPSGNSAEWNMPGVLSPEGWAKARVVEFDFGPGERHSQVLISFDGGVCGSGSVSADGIDLGLQLAWVDATTLEVAHPADVALEPAPAARELPSRHQCGDRVVWVQSRRL